MPIFDYHAKNPAGDTVKGAIEAPNIKVAADILRDQNLIVLSLSERKSVNIFQSAFGRLFSKVKVREIVVFTRQLSVMISAGIPIVRALRILIKQTDNITFKIIISDIADEVEGGARLSTALSRYPHLFNDFYVHMVRSGETTGRLDQVLEYLADQKEKDYELMSRIKSAMIYPAFIIVGMIGISIVMMVFVVPKLTSVLIESGATLPITTRILIGTSNFLVHFWWLILIFVIGLFVFYKIFISKPAGRYTVDRLKLKLPLLGSLLTKIYLTRFCHSFSTLLSAGIPLTQSLSVTADVVGNAYIKDITVKSIHEVEDGKPISTIFSQSPLIPVMLSQMMNVGEETAQLDKVLKKLGNFYSREVEVGVRGLVSLIEPMVIVLLGIGVAILVSSILLPMYNLASSFQ